MSHAGQAPGQTPILSRCPPFPFLKGRAWDRDKGAGRLTGRSRSAIQSVVVQPVAHAAIGDSNQIGVALIAPADKAGRLVATHRMRHPHHSFDFPQPKRDVPELITPLSSSCPAWPKEEKVA